MNFTALLKEIQHKISGLFEPSLLVHYVTFVTVMSFYPKS